MSLRSPLTIPKLHKPARLQSGDTVALIAPASPADSAEAQVEIQNKLTTLGYTTKLGKNVHERLGFLAGTDAARLRDVHDAFSCTESGAVLCVRGGYGSGRIINSIDFKKLKDNPKVFVGSSDLTTMLNGCLLHAGLTAFHGPTMQSLSDRSSPEFTLNSWMRQISGDSEALGSIKKGCPADELQVEVLQTGTASGRLLGGNLAVLLSSLGTPFFPSLDDSILFLEDIGETPFRIDRNLTHLLNTGALDKVRGFALGVFERCAYRPDDAVKKQSLRDVVIDRLVPLGKPVVLGLPFGHTAYNATLPVGTTVTLDGKNGDLLIEELGVR